MSAIIYDARRIKAFERLQELGQYTGKTKKEIDTLWMELVMDGALMKEFAYYLDHHCILGELQCEGYGLTDLYMWLLRQYTIRQDYGKTDDTCSKEALVLDSFSLMVEMRKDPEKYVKLLNDGFGMGMDQRFL